MHQKVVVLMFSLVLLTIHCLSQNISSQLENAIQKLTNDVQFKHAILSLYVIDSKTGKTVFEKNSQLGLSPASCQKVVTSVSAFELLGKDYQYKTIIGYDQQIDKGILKGNLYLTGLGDPTLGSDRWNTSTEAMVLKRILSILQKNKIQYLYLYNPYKFRDEPLLQGVIGL